MSKITLEEQIKCVIREIGIRKREYPYLVETNILRSKEAEYQIKVMEGVLDTLKQLEWHIGYNYQQELWEKENEERLQKVIKEINETNND